MIRRYKNSDYPQLKELYFHTEWYGGLFNASIDSQEKLATIIKKDPDSILVYEEDGKLTGTVSIIDDSRVGWLFRFVAKDNDQEISEKLYERALQILKKRGHDEVRCFGWAGNEEVMKRYEKLGMTRDVALYFYQSDL